jgi:hypothetical protein
MSKISVSVGVVMLLSLSGWAHDPQPVTTISIEDIGKKGAPVKFSGTADAYVDEAIKDLPDGVGLYVEENNLQIENVSDKTIAKMIVIIRTTDVRGNMGMSVRHFSNNYKGYMPGFAGQALATLTFPSGRKHVMTMTKVITQKEYHLKPYVAPTAKVFVVWVQFSNGEEWVDREGLDQAPDQVRAEVRAKSWVVF